eukprot:CAMPEP_0197025504 /NCGR_PEP_ID=MMETSP1384-20130603/5818_1 /TAXON_ID=29189 /ORGANISM="Ammonia sp." /LENGTH=399 /DNA_ID=CAMNT_0042454039 /DNA_START=86 /DNA_END=1285 /DNA_ORIENTATION=+
MHMQSKPASLPFARADLLSYGYNLFTNTKSGSPILSVDRLTTNIKSSTDSVSTCSYHSLQFSSTYSTYSEYAHANSNSIAASFLGAVDQSILAAAGSLTITRTQTRAASLDTRSEIYTIDLTCTKREASMVGYNQLYWDPDFVQSFKILQRYYNYSTGDDLEPFVNFWNKFGTHILSSAKFGGSIQGATIADICTVEATAGDALSWEACLNGQYIGVEVDYCHAENETSIKSEVISAAIKHTHITVKGGDVTTFPQIFSEFRDKESDFAQWLGELDALPDIVGGNAVEISDVMLDMVALGNHRFVEDSSVLFDDDSLEAIANAMHSAYSDYAQQLSEEDTVFTEDECQIDCVGGTLSSTECACTGCQGACCPFDDDSMAFLPLTVSLSSLLVLASVVFV